MRHIAFLTAIALTAAAAAAQSANQTPLNLYVGGRTVVRQIDGQASYTYAWPGVYFEAPFQGGTVDVKINDDQNDLYLYIDGVHKLTLTRPGKTTVAIKDLSEGRHIVRLEKTSETQGSTGTFEGFYVSGPAAALPAPSYDRAIEFIGDSITVGYGNMSRGQTCTVEDVRETTNTSEAWAPRAAKHFGAAYRINANSGKGIVRNYAHLVPDDILPNLYGYALFDRTTPADDSGWNPDIIVVDLGTNDFSTQLKADEPWKDRDALRTDFQKNYAAFVETLHKAHPKAHFILMASADTSPFAVDDSNELFHAVSLAADRLKAAGIKDLEILPVEKLKYTGCHGHPSIEDDVTISNLLIERIARLPKFAAAEVR